MIIIIIMVVVFLIALPGIFIDIYGYYGSLINQKFTISLDEIEIWGGGGVSYCNLFLANRFK